MERTVYIKATCERMQFSGEILPDELTTEIPSEFSEWSDTDNKFVFSKSKWLARVVRPGRNLRIDVADQRVRRYDYQLRIGHETTDTADAIARILVYMQELRDLPAVAEYDTFKWPEMPI